MAFIDRTLELAVIIMLTAILMVATQPMDYEGTTPQEGFFAAIDTRIGEALAEHEDEVIGWILPSLFGVETVGEAREYLLIESGMTALELAFIDIVEGTYSFEEQIRFLHQVLETVADADEDIFSNLPGELGYMLGLLAEVYMLLGMDSDFQGDSIIDHFFGDGMLDYLMAMDIHDRYTAMGELFGDYFAGLMADDLEMMVFLITPALLSTWIIASQVTTDWDEDFFEIFELYFGEENLEERIELIIESDREVVLIDLFVDEDYANYNLNVFLVNRGIAALEITIIVDIEDFADVEWPYTVDSMWLLPGETFTAQIPGEYLGEINFIDITSGVGGLINIEAGFRLTEQPLS